MFFVTFAPMIGVRFQGADVRGQESDWSDTSDLSDKN